MSTRLSDVAEFVRGVTFKPDDVVTDGTPGSIWCVRTKNVQSELDLSDTWSIDSSHVHRKEQYLMPGDILVSSANSWNLVGKCCRVPHLAQEGTFGGFISVLRAKPSAIDPRYLYRWFSSSKIQATVRSFGRQTTNISNLDFERCLELHIPVPEILEQERIAEILDKADELRAKREQAITLLDDLVQSIFLDMFGDLPSRFEAVSVGDLATNIRTGPFGSDLLHSEFVDDGIAVLGIDNVVNNEFTWSQRRFITSEKYQKLARYRVHVGDLLITIMGTCGRCAIVPADIPVAINTKHLCCITLDKGRCLPEFLHAYFLLHPTARRYLEQTAKGAIMSGLNATIIKSLPVQLPPFTDQERFAKTSLQLREQKSRFSGHAQELDELFKSLQQGVFGNEL